MTPTLNRRLTILLTTMALLAVSAAMLALYLAPAQAQENSVPDKPTGLIAATSHESVLLNWDDPSDNSVTGYMILRRLRYDDPSGHFDTHVTDTGTPDATYTDDDVESETHYTYRIKALNAQRESDRSTWLHVHTSAVPLPAKPTGLTTTQVAHDHVDLSWDDPEDTTITGYEILRRDKDVHQQGVFDAIEADTGSPATTYADDTVLAQKRYVYRIKALNATGKSEISEWVRGYTPAAPASAPQESDSPPSAPGNLRGGWNYLDYPDAPTLEWDAVTGDGVAYEVQVKDHRGRQWVDLGDDPAAGIIHQRDLETRIKVLAPSPRYVSNEAPGGIGGKHILMRVRTTKDGQASEWSDPHAVFFPYPSQLAAGMPSGIMTQAGQAILSWPSPSYFGNRTFTLLDTHIVYRMNRSLTNLPTGRDLEEAPAGVVPEHEVNGELIQLLPGHDVNGITVTATSSGAVVTGLPEGMPEYRFAVRHLGYLQDRGGQRELALSPWSWEISIETVLDTPGRPEATQTASVQVSLSWNAIEDATQYRLRLWADDQWEELDGQDDGEVSVSMSGATATVSGLPAGYHWYIFEVKALGAHGVKQSGWSPNIAVFNQHHSSSQ